MLNVRDSDLYALGNMSSSSPAMFERRRRILSEARRLIGSHGADFSVRELCDRAQIAPNTLYNAFGSKEAVVALTVLGYFEDFFSRTKFTHPDDCFEGMMERNIAGSLRNIALPQYVHAVAKLYFSDTENLTLRPDFDRIVGQFFLPWLERLRLERQLVKGVDLRRVPSNMSAMLFAQVLEWRVGRLDDAGFLDARTDAVLCYLGGLTKGDAERSIRRALADFRGKRTQYDAMITEANYALAKTN
jgi:AcrR family transcriptional regulator